jgi:hypothetical protein
MTKSGKVLTVLGAGATLVLVGIAVGWLGTGDVPNPEATSGAQTPSTNALKFAKGRGESLELPAAAPSQEPQPRMALTTALPGRATSDWEERLEQILGAEGKESDKAKQLLELFPKLPETGQIEAAQHLSNLIGDQEYSSLGNLLTNSTLPEGVLEVLLADVLNRPNSVKLPAILEVARDPQHPKAAEAKDLLELFLEDNFDQDWTRWQAKMEQWLKDNPD